MLGAVSEFLQRIEIIAPMTETHHDKRVWSMHLSQLETFLAVARTQNFTKAGPLVHRTQSAVSRQIQDLEKSLGTQLFERFGGRVWLTTAGRVLMEEAPRLLRQAENVQRRLRDISQGTSGDLRLGVTLSFANAFLPPILTRFRRENPLVNVSLVPGHSPDLLEQLRKNDLDAAVVGSNAEQADLVTCFRIHDELVLVAAPGHPLAHKKELLPEQLKGVDFIFREPGSDSRALVKKWLESNGVEVKTLMALW
jgi:DNA-binding transcriptional LysR family regulator